jgi:hypothetical protein
MVKFFWAITLLASLVAAAGLAASALLLNSAPQQAAGAAISLGIALIPYIFTRAVEGLSRAP